MGIFQARRLEVFDLGQVADRRLSGPGIVGFALQPSTDPVEHPHVVPETGPQVASVRGILAEEVDVEDPRKFAGFFGLLAETEPVIEVATEVVAEERSHGERIVEDGTCEK